MVSDQSASRNTLLEARMRAAEMNAADLAEALNTALLTLTGRAGALNDRAIRRFLSGQTRWPQTRQRLALEAVFECPIEELGFTPPHGSSPPEDPVHRRSFLTASSGAATSLAIPSRRIGRSDVVALHTRLDGLIEQDNHTGGNAQLETAALAHAQVALDLVKHGQATETVFREVYSLAANATTRAAWAAIDSGALDRAQRHLDRSLSLAGLSSDPAAPAQTWIAISMLSRRRGVLPEARAAADAVRALPIARRDPVYDSVGHVRAALALAAQHDASGALRALGRAEKALERAVPKERPAWLYFYDEAELHGLAAVVFVRLGRPEEAESYAHHALAHLKPDLKRNRSYYTALLGLTQLQQGELELACATVDPLLTEGLPGSSGVRDLLRTFRTEAAALGSARARRWLNDTRTPPM